MKTLIHLLLITGVMYLSELKIQPDTLRDMKEGELVKTLVNQQNMLMNEQSQGMVDTGIESSDANADENTGVQEQLRKNIARIKTIMKERGIDY